MVSKFLVFLFLLQGQVLGNTMIQVHKSVYLDNLQKLTYEGVFHNIEYTTAIYLIFLLNLSVTCIDKIYINCTKGKGKTMYSSPLCRDFDNLGCCFSAYGQVESALIIDLRRHQSLSSLNTFPFHIPVANEIKIALAANELIVMLSTEIKSVLWILI